MIGGNDLHAKAVEDFSAVIKRNPKNAHAHFRRAFSYKALKVRFFIYFVEIC
jgi:Tfp pilus assembly protein PilF